MRSPSSRAAAAQASGPHAPGLGPQLPRDCGAAGHDERTVERQIVRARAAVRRARDERVADPASGAWVLRRAESDRGDPARAHGRRLRSAIPTRAGRSYLRLTYSAPTGASAMATGDAATHAHPRGRAAGCAEVPPSGTSGRQPLRSAIAHGHGYRARLRASRRAEPSLGRQTLRVDPAGLSQEKLNRAARRPRRSGPACSGCETGPRGAISTGDGARPAGPNGLSTLVVPVVAVPRTHLRTGRRQRRMPNRSHRLVLNGYAFCPGGDLPSRLLVSSSVPPWPDSLALTRPRRTHIARAHRHPRPAPVVLSSLGPVRVAHCRRVICILAADLQSLALSLRQRRLGARSGRPDDLALRSRPDRLARRRAVRPGGFLVDFRWVAARPPPPVVARGRFTRRPSGADTLDGGTSRR
jgi:hypothetical protein